MEGGHGDGQGSRIGQTNVLGCEHHHAPGNELGVFSSGKHGVEPVQSCVGIRAAHRLDEGRDHVVVLITALVVSDDPTLQRLGDVALGDDLAVPSLHDDGSVLESVESQPGIASGSLGEGRDCSRIDARLTTQPTRISHRPANQGDQVVSLQGGQTKERRA